MPINQREPVFACAQSAYGFKSLFDKIFCPEDFDRVYILKGSCGSGKSAIIKKIARKCEENGEEYELFSCSFDPASCDGIILCNQKICIIDGTSPHAVEPRYHGAVEIVVNTSEGLDAGGVVADRDKIISLCKKSSKCFSKSYSFLRAALEIQNNFSDIACENFRHGKMNACIKRFCEQNFCRGTGFYRRERLCEVYCKDGFIKSNAFFERADKKCLVTDKFGTAHLFFRELVKTASFYDQPVVVSVSALDFERVNAVYLPEMNMAFQTSQECGERGEYLRVFNMARFTDKEVIRNNKYKIRFLKKCFDQLCDGAVSCMNEAYLSHSELENIYVLRTDYSYNDKIFDRLVSEIWE